MFKTAIFIGALSLTSCSKETTTDKELQTKQTKGEQLEQYRDISEDDKSQGKILLKKITENLDFLDITDKKAFTAFSDVKEFYALYDSIDKAGFMRKSLSIYCSRCEEATEYLENNLKDSAFDTILDLKNLKTNICKLKYTTPKTTYSARHMN